MNKDAVGSSWNAAQQWAAGDQIQGGRDYQEDDFALTLLTGDRSAGDRLLLVLADGMGGHAGGAVASRTVVAAFWDGFRRPATDLTAHLTAGVEAANEAVQAEQQADPALSEMGATLVAALIQDGHLYWASVGDSPLWVFRNGVLKRLNEDHSMRSQLLYLAEIGRMTEEEALNDPRGHQLRSVIMGDDIPLRDIAADGYALEANDIVLLASDGLETLSEADLTDLLTQHGNDAQALVAALLAAVSAAGAAHQDNTTVLAYRVGTEQRSLSTTLAQMEAPTTLAKSKPDKLHIHDEPSIPAPPPTQPTPRTPPTQSTSNIWTKIKTYMSGR